VRAARVDANHRAVVAAFEAEGCAVLSLARLGGGAPDLLVSLPGGTLILVEIKNPGTAYGRLGLSPLQAAFAVRFPVHVVRLPDEVRPLVARLRSPHQTAA
jgi:hypothetical protein